MRSTESNQQTNISTCVHSWENIYCRAEGSHCHQAHGQWPNATPGLGRAQVEGQGAWWPPPNNSHCNKPWCTCQTRKSRLRWVSVSNVLQQKFIGSHLFQKDLACLMSSPFRGGLKFFFLFWASPVRVTEQGRLCPLLRTPWWVQSEQSCPWGWQWPAPSQWVTEDPRDKSLIRTASALTFLSNKLLKAWICPWVCCQHPTQAGSPQLVTESSGELGSAHQGDQGCDKILGWGQELSWKISRSLKLNKEMESPEVQLPKADLWKPKRRIHQATARRKYNLLGKPIINISITHNCWHHYLKGAFSAMSSGCSTTPIHPLGVISMDLERFTPWGWVWESCNDLCSPVTQSEQITSCTDLMLQNYSLHTAAACSVTRFG